MSDMVEYIIELIVPDNLLEVTLSTYQGPEAAGRRAKWAAIHNGWGDVDEVKVIQVREA